MFRWTRIATFAAVAAVLAIATGVAGATSNPGSVPAAGSRAGKVTSAAATRAALLKTANLRTRAGAARYLRAIGVNPHHFVIQRGTRNYAGAKCPGKGWACTSTAHPVIQITSAGGSNTFQCATASCAVVQATTAPTSNVSAKNNATCIKTTGATQACSITQTSGATNTAIVVEVTSKMSGLTQTASADAKITQVATGTNTNTACVYQEIGIDGSTIAKKGVPVTVTLEAHQSITITQDATGSGSNTVKGSSKAGDCSAEQLVQKQTLTSTANGSGSITQNENASNNGPNMTLDIKQNQGSGSTGASGVNTAAFSQTNALTAIANTPVPPVIQKQSSLTGGLSATVNQFSSGKSTAVANQTETQCEHASTSGAVSCTTGNPPSYSLTQEQHGPLRKDSPSVQSGNPDNSFTINQTSIQNNDAGTGSNQTNEVEGACSTSGNCTSTQDTNVNGTLTHNTQTGSNVDTQINCTGNACTPSGGLVTVSNTGLSVSNIDVGEFGIGGMRGDGTGSIAVAGVTAPVIGAYLYWNGPTNSTDPASNASVTFNGTPIVGTNIGTASNNNWGFQNGQSYRADVSSLVTGNATYTLSNFRKTGMTGTIADINGVALIVFYDDGNTSNDRNVVAWNGNDSNVAFGADPANWNETISGVPYPGEGSASLDLVVSDGQSYPDADVVLNGNTGDPVAAGPSIFQGDSGPNYSGNPCDPDNPPCVTGSLWDVKSFDITRFLVSGPNTLNLTSGTAGDALSLVVAIANVPASAPVVG
jgi:hypothetical protein